jgi:adenosylhomocysteine nucleosidase
MHRVFATVVLALVWLAAGTASAQPQFDRTPRTAVMSAFPPELTRLEAATTDKQTYDVAGRRFTTGLLHGKPVVLMLSGVSMVNAAMTTQLALDRFAVSRIVFSGIAGGVDPHLGVGDVVVADRWGQYLESVMAREAAPGQFRLPVQQPVGAAHFGMIYPKPVEASRQPGARELRASFPADPSLLAIAARTAAQVQLKRCVAVDHCLDHTPRVVVGGFGLSGPAFVDNAGLRSWLYETYSARVLDMESAAVAQVAYVNGTPFIAFRSLSDLAGGDAGENQARTFFQLASDNSAAVVEAFLSALP